MSRVLLTYNVIVALLLLFILPTEIGCCSLNEYEVITLMSRNPDSYKQDPCYIQWKAEQDAKLTKLWIQRDQLEKSIIENDRRSRENERKDLEYRQNNFIPRSKKETSPWKVLGIIGGVIVGICCCAACIAMCDESDDNSPTNAISNNGESIPVLLTVVTDNTGGHQTSNSDNHFTNIIVPPQQTETHVPLMPRRQNSLPSYDDAVRMPSAPPKE